MSRKKEVKSSSFSAGEGAIAFTGFLVTFVGSLTARFYGTTQGEREAVSTFTIQALLLFVACLCSGSLFRSLSRQRRRKALSFAFGFLFVIPLFLGVDKVEGVLSRNLLLMKQEPRDFSDLRGHCGVHAGRSVMRLYEQSLRSLSHAALADLELGSRCRLRHFQLLEREGVALCKPEESRVDCNIRWMTAFSELGFWDFQSRKFFFNRLLGDQEDLKKDDSWATYAIKDQEIELRRQTLLRQAGLDDTLNAWAVLLHQKDELGHLELTLEIFQRVQALLPESSEAPSPQVLKFKDLMNELEPKKQKLIEIKKSIEALEKNRSSS